MKNSYRIVIVLVALAFFASGYVARNHQSSREARGAGGVGQQDREVLSTDRAGRRVASTNLESADLDLRPLQVLLDVVTSVREHYVEQITAKDEGRMTREAVRSMLRSLKDPNTRLLDPDDRSAFVDAFDGKFHGIGAWVGVKQTKSGDAYVEHLVVIAPVPGSPAEKAGLKTGDEIIEINGKAVLPFDPYQSPKIVALVKASKDPKSDKVQLRKKFEEAQKRIDEGVDIDITEAEDLLNKSEAKPLDLLIQPKGAAKPAKVSVGSADFTLDPITSAVESGAGYVRVNCFCKTTAANFDQAMRDLSSKQVSGLVLDLRNIAGGDPEVALQIARWFAPGKSLATVARSRNRRETLRIPNDAAVQVWKTPVVILVNRGTAGTAEVLASALKDGGAARLAGETTYGDYSETTLIEQADGSGILMTTGKYLSVRGADRGKSGLTVDVAATPGATADGQLQQAIKALKTPAGRS